MRYRSDSARDDVETTLKGKPQKRNRNTFYRSKKKKKKEKRKMNHKRYLRQSKN